MYLNEPLKQYLDALASKSPAPGGGSAAALVGALGVGLISMVANFTIGKEKYQEVEAEMKKIVSSSEDLRQKLMKSVDDDIASYQKVSRVFKLPKENPDDKRKREKAMQEALKEASTIPLEVCKCCYEAITLCPPLAEKGNVNLVSDVGVAVALLEAAFRSASLNVDINLNGIKDQEFIIEMREMLDPLEEEISVIKDKVWQKVKRLMTSGK